MEALAVRWRALPPRADPGEIAQALKAQPGTPRRLADRGDVDAALASAAKRMPRLYSWPFQLHGSIGPSAAVAVWKDGRLTVWSGTQNPHSLRADLARLFAIEVEAVEIVRLEAAGCYGRNGADDVSADAALLAKATGRPVRVQLTRAQEHEWEPKGAGQLMEVDGGLDALGGVAAYDFQSRYPSNLGPNLALLLTGVVPPVPQVAQMGDRTAVPPYDFDNLRVTVHDMAPIVRASWMRGVSALPNTFAHESYVDELAAEAGVDPVEFRLRHLRDPRAIALVKEVTAKADWQARKGPRLTVVDSETVKGQGFAYAVYVHGTFPGTAAASAAWVADVEVNRRTGVVSLSRVTVGQDSGLVVNPAGVTHQVEGNVIQSASRALKEELTFRDGLPAARDWGAYPILKFDELPSIDVLLVPRPDDPPLGVGESASVPSAAAIANAIFDATGVRLREPPFTPEKMRAAMGLPPPAAPVQVRRKPGGKWIAAAASIFAGLAAVAITLPFKPAIPPIPKPDPSVFSAETIARGRTLSELGDCRVCHTVPGGVPMAGGRPLETPFGTIYSTNITPDPETGIGAWSYPAFERAMREGVHRDGKQLYPAFPYTSFARTNDADLQALYAFLMSEPAVVSPPRANALRFPFDQRPLMAGWNSLFHSAKTFAPEPGKSTEWNRGAYLVEGLGHCSACHSPRNALGAELKGRDHLGGGVADGWDAPALSALSRAPLAWTEADLFAYLRTGYSDRHGPAGGPMAPVIASLSALPDGDIRAMATYLAGLNPATRDDAAASIEAKSATTMIDSPGARIFDGACAVCHEKSGPVLFGVKPSLALNSNLQAERPDNLIRVILDGMPLAGSGDRGAMPAFREAFDDRQISELVAYLRARYAPERPTWTDLESTASRIRAEPRMEW
jgi:nicotinate dehydrogenase subunit B